MANSVGVRRHQLSMSSSSRYVAKGDGLWTLVGKISAGPSFVEVKPRSKAPGRVTDSEHIREYFSRARCNLRLDEPTD